MSSANDHDSAQLLRLLEACRKGLDHDLRNRHIALRGWLQELQQQETDRLSSAGQDSVRRLLDIIQRAQALRQTLVEIARQGGNTPSASVTALAELLEKGLNHHLPSQHIALHGLLQLLQQEEIDRLSSAGQDSVRRLLDIIQRTQVLTRTLEELASLGGSAPPASVVALPELLEEVLAECSAPPPRTVIWDVPRVQAPRLRLHQAMAQALRLLLEKREGRPVYLNLISQPAPAGVELIVAVSSVDTAFLATNLASLSATLPKAWHERVECVLLRELADCWGGSVRWQKDSNQLAVTLTLLEPP
jgi:hypothetical protein